MIAAKSTVSIWNKKGIQATGFIVKFSDQFYLITAGHTFRSFHEIENHYFIYNTKKISLVGSDYIWKYIKNPDTQMIYHDYAIILLPNSNWEYLNLVKYSENGERERFWCYGFEDNGELKRVDRDGRKCDDFTYFQNKTDRKKPYKVLNCRAKYG